VTAAFHRPYSTYAPAPIDVAPAVVGHPETRELKVIIRPYNMDYWRFEGTRAQLEAEGVLPPDVVWPEGDQLYRWKSGRSQFVLCRMRPEGIRGPKRVWTSGDWWSVRCEYDYALSEDARTVLQKERELAEVRYRLSPAGKRQSDAEWRRHWAAHTDKAFQAFKATFMPIRKKPGRKPKASS